MSWQANVASRRDWEPIRHRYGKDKSDIQEQKSLSQITPSQNSDNSSLLVGSDSVHLDWLKYYASNSIRSFDDITAVAVDSKGNVYVTGLTDSTLGFVDIMTIKYSAGGTLRWMRRYLNDNNHEDIPYAIAVDKKGNVYVAGTSYSWTTYYDFVTIKYDSNGTEQWEKTYDGPDHDYDLLTSMAIDTAGNVYVAGGSFSYSGYYDYLTVKYDSDGIEQWEERYDGPGGYDDGINAIALDDSGNVYVTGLSNSVTSADITTIKYNSAGVQQWLASYDGPEGDRDEAVAVKLDVWGDVYVTGDTYKIWPDIDFVTIAYTATGVQEWAALYDGPQHLEDFAIALAVDSSANVYVGGKVTASSASEYDFGTVKYNANGVEQWVRIDNPGSYAALTDLALDPSGNVVVTGAFINFLTIKYQPDGTKLWQVQYDGPKHGNEYANALAIDSQGDVIVAGESEGINTYFDFATVKYSSSGVQQWVQRFNGTGKSDDVEHGIKVDKFGNSYIAVEAASYPDSGPIAYMILLKYSSNGDTLWTRSHPNMSTQGYTGSDVIALDTTGNVYLVGENNNGAPVVVKHDPTGAQVWSRVYAIGTRYILGVATDQKGNIYVGGLGGNGGDYYFLLKYDPNGNLLWSSEPTSGYGPAWVGGGLAVDAHGNTVMTGYGQPGSMTMMWDAQGNKKWLAISDGYPESICMDDSDNTYITGVASPAITKKFDANGNLEWGNYEGGWSIGVDVDRDVYVLGVGLTKYQANGIQVWRDSSVAGKRILVDQCGMIYAADNRNPPVVVTKVDPAGQVLWEQSFDPFHSLGFDRPRLEVDNLGRVYVAGDGGIAIGGDHYACYVAKFEQVPTLELSRDTLNLAQVNITCKSEDTVTITSSLCTTTDMFSISSSDSSFSATPLESSSFLSLSHQFAIHFQPVSPGMFSGTISFVHTFSNVCVSLAVEGTGISDSSDVFVPVNLGTGWQLVSLPVQSHCPRYLPSLFEYNGIYQSAETLAHNKGYWSKLTSPILYFAGQSIDAETIAVNTYWNLIGSISTPVAVTHIASIPPGIVTSQFFGYGNSYATADSIQPGRAYWVKSSQAGQLILSAGSAAPSVAIRITPTSELPPPPPGESGTPVQTPVAPLPKEFVLEQNYPNPFNPTTRIRYGVPTRSRVLLKLYNALGQAIRTLVDEVQDAGYRSMDFDGSNISSGVYFYRLQAQPLDGAHPSSFIEIKKMVLIK